MSTSSPAPCGGTPSTPTPAHQAPLPKPLPVSIAPTVTWVQAQPVDVLAALASLRNPSGYGRAFSFQGEGTDTFLVWARVELTLAEGLDPATRRDEFNRHCFQAVGHARRALDCLFDAYLHRDWLESRLADRAQFSAKLELLKKRPGLSLPAALIPAIVSDPRNDAEHKYVTPSLDTARKAVEAAEVISSWLRQKCPPLEGPVLAGSLAGGSASTAAGSTHRWFTGFTGPFGLTWRGTDGTVRVGSGVLVNGNPAEAEVQFCAIDELTEVEHFQLILWWNGVTLTSVEREDGVRDLLRLAHLDQP